MPEKKKTSKNKKEKPLSSAAQIQHYNALLIEDLKSDFKFVVEHMNGIEKRLTERMDRTDAANQQRFDTIEAILKLHSQHFQKNEERWQKNEERWQKNEERLGRIETKLDQVVEKVERHDQEIQEIKTHLALPH
jgi:uncharacterized protein (DUF3084 family)